MKLKELVTINVEQLLKIPRIDLNSICERVAVLCPTLDAHKSQHLARILFCEQDDALTKLLIDKYIK